MTTVDDDLAARAPKQERSRQSFERVLDAAAELLASRGDESFTLVEVGKLAGVSTGSIYARVDSKDELIRAVHRRQMQRIDDENQRLRLGSEWDGAGLNAVLSELIARMATILHRHAPLLRPLMIRADSDEQVATAGKASHQLAEGLFWDEVARCSDEIGGPDPDGAIHWCFTVVYSVLARHLGLGSTAEVAGEGDWREITGRLTAMCTAYLITERGPDSANPDPR